VHYFVYALLSLYLFSMVIRVDNLVTVISACLSPLSKVASFILIYAYFTMAAKALIYGLSNYTDTWVKIRRGYKGIDLVPATSFETLPTDLPKYPKAKVIAVACWSEFICTKVDGLHISETLSPLVTDVYSSLASLAKDTSAKVRLFYYTKANYLACEEISG